MPHSTSSGRVYPPSLLLLLADAPLTEKLLAYHALLHPESPLTTSNSCKHVTWLGVYRSVEVCCLAAAGCPFRLPLTSTLTGLARYSHVCYVLTQLLHCFAHEVDYSFTALTTYSGSPRVGSTSETALIEESSKA